MPRIAPFCAPEPAPSRRRTSRSPAAPGLVWMPVRPKNLLHDWRKLLREQAKWCRKAVRRKAPMRLARPRQDTPALELTSGNGGIGIQSHVPAKVIFLNNYANTIDLHLYFLWP